MTERDPLPPPLESSEERAAIERLDAKFKAMYRDVPLVADGELPEDEPTRDWTPSRCPSTTRA